MPPNSGRVVPRQKLLNCLRERGWRFHLETPRRDVFAKAGEPDILIPKHKPMLSEDVVRATLAYVRFTPEEVEKFLGACSEAHCH